MVTKLDENPVDEDSSSDEAADDAAPKKPKAKKKKTSKKLASKKKSSTNASSEEASASTTPKKKSTKKKSTKKKTSKKKKSTQHADKASSFLASEPEPRDNSQMLVLGVIGVVAVLGVGMFFWSNRDRGGEGTADIAPTDTETDPTILPGSAENPLMPGLTGPGLTGPGLTGPGLTGPGLTGAAPPPTPRPGAIAAPPDVASPPDDATTTDSGLASKVITAGSGTEHPGARDRVTVHYTGWTTDGQMFDSSRTGGAPAEFGLDGVIDGWTEGVQLMVVGETRRMWIPQGLAYRGRPGSPAGMLVFDIELVSFEAAPPLPDTPENLTPPRNAQRTESGLSSRRLEAGTGDTHPTTADIVAVNLDGWTSEGELFDSTSTRGQPLTIPLGSLSVAGLREGIQLMVAGEKRRFWIPEELSFAGRPGAPAGMVVFDVQLITVTPRPAGRPGMPPGAPPPGHGPP